LLMLHYLSRLLCETGGKKGMPNPLNRNLR